MKLKPFRTNVFKTVACTDDNCYKIYMKGIDHSSFFMLVCAFPRVSDILVISVIWRIITKSSMEGEANFERENFRKRVLGNCIL